MQSSSPSHDSEGLRLEGIAALQSGDLPRARDLLAQAIRANPRDELAWLWLSGALDSDDERRRCLERVLQLDPQNAAARQGLALLAARPRAAAPAQPPPARAPKPAPAPAPTQPVAPAPPAQPKAIIPPPIEVTSPALLGRPAVTPDARPQLAEADPLAALRPAPRHWPASPLAAAVIALTCVALVLGAIVVQRRLAGGGAAAQPTSPAVAVATATATPAPTRPRPTQAPTATTTAAPTSVPTATPLPTAVPTPSPADKLVQQGRTKAQRKDYQGAIASYNQALKRDPQNAAAYLYRAQARYATGKYQAAIDDYTTSLKYAPSGDAYVGRGDARLKLKDRAGALGDYQRAAEIYTTAGDSAHADEVAAKIKALQ